MKKVFILWSGGLDSTYLVNEYIKSGYDVTTGYIEISNNNEKTKRELCAKDKMKEYFSKFNNFKDLGTIYQCNILTDSINVRLSYPIQFMNIVYDIGNYDEIAIGYVMNDDAISFLPEIQACWNGYKGLVDYLPILTFPLIKITKSTEYNSLPIELKDHVTWCESPSYIESNCCDNCIPCKKMKYFNLI